MHISSLARRRPLPLQNDLCTTFCNLYIATRGLSISSGHRAAGGSNNATPNPMHSAPPQTTKRDRRAKALLNKQSSSTKPVAGAAGAAVVATPTEQEKLAAARKRAEEAMEATQKRGREAQRTGGFDKTSIFADGTLPPSQASTVQEALAELSDTPVDPGTPRLDLANRSPANMQARLNPKPLARARWQRKMVIRHIQHRGRLPRAMVLARTERKHLSKSRFFKTSVKKLVPLARQIAGKSLDEAILQMRFSKKKAAIEVKKHLIQARNEAIVVRGMGLDSSSIPAPQSPMYDVLTGATPTPQTSTDPKPYIISDPSNIVPPTGLTIHNRPREKKPTDMYIAEAWVNKGPFRKRPSPRARGRMDIIKNPFTGISVLLKEEKTRTREQAEKEAKEIRKRLSGKKLWTQLPDRPVTRQSQYVLW